MTTICSHDIFLLQVSSCSTFFDTLHPDDQTALQEVGVALGKGRQINQGLRRLLATAGNSVTDLEASVSAKDKELKTLKDKLAAIEDTNINLVEEAEEAERIFEGYKSREEEFTAIQAAKEKEMKVLNDKLAAVEDSNINLEKEVELYKSREQMLEDKIENSRNVIVQNSSKIDDLSKKLKQAIDKKLKQAIDEQKKELDTQAVEYERELKEQGERHEEELTLQRDGFNKELSSFTEAQTNYEAVIALKNESHAMMVKECGFKDAQVGLAITLHEKKDVIFNNVEALREKKDKTNVTKLKKALFSLERIEKAREKQVMVDFLRNESSARQNDKLRKVVKNMLTENPAVGGLSKDYHSAIQFQQSLSDRSAKHDFSVNGSELIASVRCDIAQVEKGLSKNARKQRNKRIKNAAEKRKLKEGNGDKGVVVEPMIVDDLQEHVGPEPNGIFEMEGRLEGPIMELQENVI